MAGTKVRGITIELSADASGINSALKDVNKNISSTGRELRDIDKLLKLDPTNVQLLAQKQEALQRQMEQTRKKVELLKEAEEDLKGQMVDGGTEEQKKQLAALEREIISAEKSLDKYADEMDHAGDETKELAQNEREAESATGDMSQGFTVLKGALANLAADGIRKAAEALKSLMTEGPAYADEILSMASKTSVATETLQELSYMSDLVDVDVNTVAKSMQKLTKSMASAQGGSGATAESFKDLGVEVVGTDGHLRDNEEVFYDVIEALGKIENETERDAKSMQIFGKSATELNPMIEAGGDALRGFAEEAHEMGYVLDGESLEVLGRVQDAFDRFDRKMQSVKNTVAAGLAPAMERGMKKLQSAVDRVNWEKVGKQMGEAFEGIISAFEWIIDNGDAIKAVLTGIIAAFAAQKIIQVVQGIQKMTKALLAMNAAANANPYMLLITAIVGIAAATTSALLSAQAAYKENNKYVQGVEELTTKLDEHIEVINEMATSYDEAKRAREESMNAGLAEIGHVETLTAELSTLVDENGNVTKANKDRAEFILGELNQALGTEYQMTGLNISNYKEMTGAIREMIVQKKAEIVLQAQEDAYRQAIVGRADAERELETAVQNRAATEQYMAEIAQQIKEKQDLVNSSLAGTSQGAYALGNDLAILNEAYNAAKGKLEEYDTAIETSAAVVDKYAYDVTQYEANATKAITGDYKTIAYTSWETAKAQGQASTTASQTVISKAKEGATEWLKQVSKMVSDATGKNIEFKDAGNGMVQAYVDGQKQGEALPAAQVESMAKQMMGHVTQLNAQMQASAANIGAGVAQGVYDGSGEAFKAMTWLGEQMLQTFKSTIKEGSPARAFMPSGYNIDAGIAVGLKKGKKLVTAQMIDISDSVKNAFNPIVSGYGNIGVNGGSGGSSVANNFTQNIYAPKQPSRLELYRQTRNLLEFAGRI